MLVLLELLPFPFICWHFSWALTLLGFTLLRVESLQIRVEQLCPVMEGWGNLMAFLNIWGDESFAEVQRRMGKTGDSLAEA